MKNRATDRRERVLDAQPASIFEELALPRSKSTPGTGTEVITEPKRVEAVMRGLFSHGTTARIRSPGSPPGHDTLARTHQLDLNSSYPLRWSTDYACPSTPFEVLTFGYNSGFAFQGVARKTTAKDGIIELELPDRLMRTRGQRHRRMISDTKGVAFFRHPTQGLCRRPLHDLSFEGLCFLVNSQEDRLHRGLRLEDFEVHWPDGRICRFVATVQHASILLVTRQETVCGLHLTPLTLDDRILWMAQVSRLMYPHTRLNSGQEHQLWDLFLASGYSDLAGKSPSALGTMSAFGETSRRLARAPDIGGQVCWITGDRIDGAVTLLKPYRHTWVGYQLARRPTESGSPPARQVLREVLLHGYEYPQQDPDFQWMVTWVRLDGRFSRLLMIDLTERFAHDKTRADIVRFRAMVGSTEDPAVSLEADVEIKKARKEDLEVLLTVIGKTRSPAYARAHDFVPGGFGLSDIKPAWHRAGLVRDREVLILRREGRARAAAVCEIVSDGLHLYRLFDLVRLFPLVPDGEREFAALLHAARAWYRERGKDSFAYFCEIEDPSHALDAGLEDLGEADMTIIAAELMPDQLEHAWEVTAPKEF